MDQKESAITFLKMAGSGDVRAAYEKFIASTFIHHNLYFKGDRESLMKAMEEAHEKRPNKSIDVKHVYQDGNTIITHSQVLRREPHAAPIAVVHIFRFENHRVVELWDLGQEIMKNSPNEHGAF
jgi:predicted SnoaL-like aldol condensation-catalyzing enzyme